MQKISLNEVNVIFAFREAFDEPIRNIRKYLHVCDDGCPSIHLNAEIIYNESCHNQSQNLPSYTLSGHPLSCYAEDGNCFSKFRILRAASTHYPLLRSF